MEHEQHGDGEAAPSAFGADVSVVAAAFDTMSYVGNYQGVIPALQELAQARRLPPPRALRSAIERLLMPVDHPLRKMDNVVLTPHLGYVSLKNYQSYFTGVVEDIRAYLDGKPTRVMTN